MSPTPKGLSAGDGDAGRGHSRVIFRETATHRLAQLGFPSKARKRRMGFLQAIRGALGAARGLCRRGAHTWVSAWDLGQGNREAGEGDASSAHKAVGVALSLDVGVARAAGAGGPSSSSWIPSSLQRKRFLGRVGRPLARSRSRLRRVWALPLPPGCVAQASCPVPVASGSTTRPNGQRLPLTPSGPGGVRDAEWESASISV